MQVGFSLRHRHCPFESVVFCAQASTVSLITFRKLNVSTRLVIVIFCRGRVDVSQRLACGASKYYQANNFRKVA